MKKRVTRLATQFAPKNYQLTLDVDPNKHTFEGTVIIFGKKIGRPSKRLTLHQKDLRITTAIITHHDKKVTSEIQVTRINMQKSFDEVRLHTEKTLFPGAYTITLTFRGKITDQMNGLYPCYFTHEKKKKKLFATQFESHHAREVFPSIDEPEAKATFDLTLVTPADTQTVLANTPILSTNNTSGKTTTVFETTPIMSTYLLAFAFGELGYKEAKTSRGTLVRTYATPSNVAHTEFALDTAIKCLEFYEDYFDIPYPLEKCDMIALPDFASGAMENWGLITYREQTMLVDPKNTSLSTKQYVAMVVAHELAHQWFGNLVTMKWWTDLWLNEGFASWIEYLAVDHLYPDWDMWTQFITSEQQTALKLDALDNTHPIEAPINHPDEIRTIFDAISYNKGASVIHMLHDYLGAEDFKKGLRHYLKEHAYKNTVTADLWAALEKASKKPVKSFMHAWTTYPGFPLVKVSENNAELHITQERFYVQKPSRSSRHHWPVPLLSDTKLPDRLDTATITVLLKQPLKKPIKLNQHQSGFYRTLYAPELLTKLADDVKTLEPLDRLGILADSLESAKAGYGPTVPALKLLFGYQQESNAAVWDIITAGLGELKRTMDDDTIRESIKPHIRTLTSKQRARLGFNEKKSDTHFDKLLRPTILGLSAAADESEVVTWCKESFKKARSPADIHADVRSVVFSTSARHGDAKTFKKLLSFHAASESSEDRITIAAALTSFEYPELIKQSLELITTNEVRRQDAMYWVAYSFMNRHAKAHTWQWMKDNWKWLETELGSDLSFYRTPIYAARSFSDKQFLADYEAFFAKHTSASLERSIKQGVEMLQGQIAWKDRDLSEIQVYLRS